MPFTMLLPFAPVLFVPFKLPVKFASVLLSIVPFKLLIVPFKALVEFSCVWLVLFKVALLAPEGVVIGLFAGTGVVIGSLAAAAVVVFTAAVVVLALVFFTVALTLAL